MDNSEKMDLREFLSYFDFDYKIVSPGSKCEDDVRQKLIRDGRLDVSEAAKDLICLVDRQGAYLGDIGIDRYSICMDSVQMIVERMDIYIQEYIK